MAGILFCVSAGLVAVLVCVLTAVFGGRRRRAVFAEQFPPISDA